MLRLAYGLSRAEQLRAAALASITLACGLAMWLPVALTAVASDWLLRGVLGDWGAQALVQVAFAGAVVSIVVYAGIVLRQSREQHAHYVADGAAIFCFLASAYVAFAAGDSYWFYAAEHGRKVDLPAQSAQGEKIAFSAGEAGSIAADQVCGPHADFFLATKLDASFVVNVRCPKWVSLLNSTDGPFVPWPSYVQKTITLGQPLR